VDRNDKVFTLLSKIVMHKTVSPPDEIIRIIYDNIIFWISTRLEHLKRYLRIYIYLRILDFDQQVGTPKAIPYKVSL